MLKVNLKYDGVSKRSWLSPDKRYRAKIHFDFDLDQVQFTAILFRARSSQELTRKPFGTVKPCMTPSIYASNVSWISPTKLQVLPLDVLFSTLVWTIDFSDEIGTS
jgi:hypothetical protein